MARRNETLAQLAWVFDYTDAWAVIQVIAVVIRHQQRDVFKVGKAIKIHRRPKKLLRGGNLFKKQWARRGGDHMHKTDVCVFFA